MNRVIIAGGRDFNSDSLGAYLRVNNILNCIQGDIELVTGTARGADQLAYRFKNQYPIKEFPADWDKYGKSAGHIRNKQMANYATHLIAFWDGKSKGTEGMIKAARFIGLKVKVIKYTFKVKEEESECYE